jgi:hypothetical protein
MTIHEYLHMIKASFSLRAGGANEHFNNDDLNDKPLFSSPICQQRHGAGRVIIGYVVRPIEILVFECKLSLCVLV